MPYITQTDKDKFVYDLCNSKQNLAAAVGELCETAGDLNYAFTVIAHNYLKNKGLKYQHINDIIGALEGSKLELYRRVAASYEDEKITLNGDVFEI